LQVAEAIAEHGADARVHGVVVQLPLPKHLDQAELLGTIPAEKDVDCLTPLSLGRLAMAGSGEPAGLPSVRPPSLSVINLRQLSPRRPVWGGVVGCRWGRR
jgi:5,10-methylene-tetrahydrofolate dehydrogenase/methenyl tetrahydrofolate cyclohydrolase